MKKNAVKDEFDEFAPVYNQVAIEDLEYDAYIKIPNEMIQFNDQPKATVLDLGCGTGLSSEVFLEKECEVTGIDLSNKMLKEAKKLNFKELILHDLNEKIWPKLDRYDYIVALGTIEFMEDPSKFLSQCYNLLNDGGIAGITFPLNCYSEATIPVRSFTLEEVQQLCHENQLELKELCMFTGYRMPTEDIDYIGVIVTKENQN
ncbi:MAG: class I SAM-dependent methyltransferase [Lentisphaeria bacterium]|nr:class I SAM-dependent methyltransferase [Lentisphaeria bacterium]